MEPATNGSTDSDAPMIDAAESKAPEFDYDLAVIGGGSGGLACSKEAAALGARVICFDFVKPSPAGTTWGLGGTCVNVGCIPKKLFHYSGLIRKKMEDAKHFGWEFSEPKLNWHGLVENVRDYIGSLNFSYKNALMSANVKYENAYVVFKDPHTLEFTGKRSKKLETITANYIVIATGAVRIIRRFRAGSSASPRTTSSPSNTLPAKRLSWARRTLLLSARGSSTNWALSLT